MRKSEKLSDAIGEISDDIVEEAYTYESKHDTHHRKASFKWRAAAAVLAMLVLVGVGVSVGEELPFSGWERLLPDLRGRLQRWFTVSREFR